MTFPVVEAMATTAVASAQTSHVYTLPTGIVSGELVVLCMGIDYTPGTGAPGLTNSGWTQKVLNDTALNEARFAVFYRIADGTWPAGAMTVTVTSSTSQESAAIIFRVSGHSTSANGISSFETRGDSPSVNPNSGNLSSSIGAADILWVSFYLADNTFLAGTPVYPTNYTALAQLVSGTAGTDSVTVGAAWRTSNAASEDPGAFTATLTSSTAWIAATLAIYPGTEGRLNAIVVTWAGL